MSPVLQELDRYGLIGPGALGEALALALRKAELQLTYVGGSSIASSSGFVNQFGEGRALPTDDPAFAEVPLLLIAVPDDVVSEVAAGLAGNGADWNDVVVLHTSGALDASELAPLAEVGASTGSFHPIQTFSRPASADAFRGITIGIEGSEAASAVGTRLADTLCAEAVPLTAEQKILYHSAAVIAGNFANTLLSVASEVWGEAVSSGASFHRALSPLVRRSIENSLEKGPGKALSGPIARGDVRTLVRELDALEAATPHLMPVFASLAVETVHLATRSGTLSSESAVRMLDLIRRRLDSTPDPEDA